METMRNPEEQRNFLNTLFTDVWQSYLKNKVTQLTEDQLSEINSNVLQPDTPYQLEFNKDGLTFANEKMKIEFDGNQISKLTLIDPDKDA